jgi:hypothetical protein
MSHHPEHYDPGAVQHGHAHLIRALSRLDQPDRLALTEVLGTLSIANAQVSTGTTNLPMLAGTLLVVVDAYRGALAELGRRR